MYIHEAIMKTSDQFPCITRGSWDAFNTGKPIVKIYPTDTPDLCVIVSDYSANGPRRGWEPGASDLTADDWEVCAGSLIPKLSRYERK